MQVHTDQTPTMDPLARIVIVNYNSAGYVNRCIDSLLAQTEQRFEVVIADNASTDADAIRLPDDPRFRLVRFDRNLGFAAANNLAAAGATAPWIVTLNPDAFPRPDWLEILMAAACRHPDAAMFGSTQLFADDPSMVDGEGDRYSIFGLAWRVNYGRPGVPPYYTGEVFSPCAAAAMYRRDVFERVGGFDEAFFCYCEDVDLGFRIRLAGGRAYQIGDAVVHHVSSGVSKQYGDFALYHGIRNLFWTMVKNVPFPVILLTLPLHGLALAYLLAFRWRAQRARTARRAIRDAVLGVRHAVRQRRSIQHGRCVPMLDLMRAMTWNPIKVKLRQ
jgi:N-acetylglucosaminyl-diphospho-decaprenol L-rhamnosyltransferase